MRAPLVLTLMLAAGCSDRPIDLPEPVADAAPAVRFDLRSVEPVDLSVPADLQLADLSVPPDLALPVVCTVSPCAVEVVVAADASCARFTDGTVRCWGDDRSAQLGRGTVSGSPATVAPASAPSPSPIPGLSGAGAVSLGGFFPFMSSGCAVVSGQVECWGSDYYGQLGRGGPTVNAVLPSLPPPGPFFPQPAAVAGLSGVDEVAVGGAHGCARMGGLVSCWGSTNGAAPPIAMDGSGAPVFYRPTAFAVPLPHPARRIAAAGSGGQDAGGNATCALFDDQSVGCWGYESTVLQNGADSFGVHRVPIPAAEDLSVGYGHACAVSTAGEVWCWGDPSESARGPNLVDAGESIVESTPTRVPLPERATHVSAGFLATCALLAGGGVACWGLNDSGQGGQVLPLSLSSPVRVPNLDDAVGLATGSARHVCALERSGRVVCWGSGANGALGGPAGSAQPVPIIF